VTAPDVSLVLVAHRSSLQLPRAVTAFRAEAQACGCAGEVIVVEQSEEDAEAERAAATAPEHLLRRPNRGYAAGINAGLERAGGRWCLVGNPDVELRPGALAPLLAALRGGWGVAGPQFELADACFPPAEEQTPPAEVRRRRALRDERSWRRYMQREAARCLRVWQATEPVEQPTLSGALLAFERAAADRVGRWDEGYFLYFEETDWLRRARRTGLRLAIVPAARAVHRWGHAARPAAAGEIFARSQRRFYTRTYPLRGPLALGARAGAPPPARSWEEGREAVALRWLISPRDEGFPAALVAPAQPPAGVALAFARSCELTRMLLVGVSERGHVVGPFVVRAPSSSGDDAVPPPESVRP